MWKDGTESEWEGAIGEVENKEGDNDNNNDDDIDRNCDEVTIDSSTVAAGADDFPVAVYHLNPVARRDGVGTSYKNVVDDDKSEMDEDGEEEEREVETVGGITTVRLLSLDFFRSKLITHFAIALKRNEVFWPRQLRKWQPVKLDSRKFFYTCSYDMLG